MLQGKETKSRSADHKKTKEPAITRCFFLFSCDRPCALYSGIPDPFVSDEDIVGCASIRAPTSSLSLPRLCIYYTLESKRIYSYVIRGKERAFFFCLSLFLSLFSPMMFVFSIRCLIYVWWLWMTLMRKWKMEKGNKNQKQKEESGSIQFSSSSSS